MNTRVIAASLLSVLLASCGGGSGAGGAVPAQPGGATTQLVKFSFKVPAKTAQVIRKKLIGGKYVSPATLGVGISYSTTATTFTATQLTTPTIALDLSSCTGTAVSSCTTNPTDGSRLYTLLIPLPPASYAFEVVTWDCKPSGSPLTFGGNQLSNALTSVTVTAGGAPPAPNFVLNAVPASLVLTPVPGQTHVSGNAAPYSITGNAAQQFFVNALDPDGFIITGLGAPTVSLSDATGSFTFAQNTSNPNVTNEWSIEALRPALQNTNGVNVSLNATAPGATTPVTSNVTIVPIPELWITESGTNVVSGYPMKVTTGASPTVSVTAAPTDSFTAGANAGPLVADNAGNIWVAQGTNIQEFNAPVFSGPPTVNSNYFRDPCLGTPTGLALDANGYIVVVDPTCNGGDVSATNPAALGKPAYEINSTTQTSLAGATSVSFAPSSVPAALAPLPNSLVVGATTGKPSIDILTTTTSSVTDAIPGESTPSGSMIAVGIGTDGNLWYADGTNVNVAMPQAGAAPPPALLGSTALTTTSAQFAADSIGEMWVPYTTGSSPYIYYYVQAYKWNGTSVVGGASLNMSSGYPATGVYIAP